jgi:hypothetical protein
VITCNLYCSGKAISITHPDYVFVALGIQRDMRMHHIVICGLKVKAKVKFNLEKVTKAQREAEV